MPYPAESLYEILGVPHGASLSEIMRAYQQALRAGKFPKNKIAQAFNDARNPRKRAEASILAYPVADDPVAVAALLADPPRAAFLPDTVTPMPIPPALTDMALHDPSIDFLDVPECPLDFRPGDEFPLSKGALPPLTFPA